MFNLPPETALEISSDFEGNEVYLEIKVKNACHTFVLTKHELAELIDDLEDTLSLLK